MELQRQLQKITAVVRDCGLKEIVALQPLAAALQVGQMGKTGRPSGV